MLLYLSSISLSIFSLCVAGEGFYYTLATKEYEAGAYGTKVKTVGLLFTFSPVRKQLGEKLKGTVRPD